MHEWEAQAWSEDMVENTTVTADNMTEAAAKVAAELDHLEVVELHIWRADR